MVSKFVILALCCVYVCATGNVMPGGPVSNLTAQISDDLGATVNAKVTWNKGGNCWLIVSPSYTLKYCDEHGECKTEDEAKHLETNITNLEHWSNYTISIIAECMGSDDTTSTNLLTGPGAPHPVRNLQTTDVSPFSVLINWEDADKLPKIPECYEMTICNDVEGCVSWCEPRNAVMDVDGKLSKNITSLKPQTQYRFNISAVIKDKDGKNYTSEKIATNFTTAEADVPTAHDIITTITNQTDSVMVNVTWKIKPTTEYTISGVLLNITTSEGIFVQSHVVGNQTEDYFKDIPYFGDFILEIRVQYTKNETTFWSSPALKNFSSGVGVVFPPEDLEFANLNTTTVLIGWKAPKHPFSIPITAYNATVCLAESVKPADCFNSTPSMKLSELMTSLKADTNYTIYVTSIVNYDSQMYTSKELSTTFTSLRNDYDGPNNVTVGNIDDVQGSAMVEFQWVADSSNGVVPSMYTLFVCNANNSCSKSTSNETRATLSLQFFEKYNLTIEAEYDLHLNQKVWRNSTVVNIPTGVTNPGEVKNFHPSDIKTDSVTLSWEKPDLYGDHVTDYLLTNWQTEEEFHSAGAIEYTLRGLKMYTNTTVSISAMITVNDGSNKTHFGNETILSFFTDVGAPSAVTNFTVTQKEESNDALINWAPPTTPNGPIDFYNVTIAEINGTYFQTSKICGGLGYTARLPGKDGAVYNITVLAVNINFQDKEVEGLIEHSELNFRGIGEPQNATVSVRLANSLMIDIVPPKDREDDVHLFYKLFASPANVTKFVAPGKRVLSIDNLPPYTNQSVQIRACLSEKFCGEPITIEGKTNVGGPSVPQNVTVEVKNDTNIFVTWKTPSELNGPLDGYKLTFEQIVDEKKSFTLELNGTTHEYMFETSDEYERYNVSIVGFNYEEDTPKEEEESAKKVMGIISYSEVNTTGAAPPKPVDVNEDLVSSTEIALSWTKPDSNAKFDVTLYKIIRQVTNDYFEIYTNLTEISFDNLSPYKNYTILLYGCTAEKECGQPRSVVVQTEVDFPTRSESLKIKETDTHKLTLTWEAPNTPNGPINGYSVCPRVTTDTIKDCTFVELPSSKFEYTFEKLNPSTNYTLVVVAFNINNNGTRLNSPLATTTALTSGVVNAAGLPVWAGILIALAVVGVLGGAAYMVYMKRKSSRGSDEEGLLRAE